MHNIYTARVDDSTLNDVIEEGENRWRRWVGLAVLGSIALLVIAALTQLLDRDATTQISTPERTVNVSYPSIARAGNEINLELTIGGARELPETVTLELNKDYLMLFEDLTVFPEPDSETSDGQGNTQFEVATQPGSDRLHVRFTGKASDQWEARTTGTLKGQVAGDDEQFVIELETWRIP